MNKGKSKDFPFFVMWRGGYWISLFGIVESFGDWVFVRIPLSKKNFSVFPKYTPGIINED